MEKLENCAVNTYLVNKLCHHLKFTQIYAYIKILDNDISFLNICQQLFYFLKTLKQNNL